MLRSRFLPLHSRAKITCGPAKGPADGKERECVCWLNGELVAGGDGRLQDVHFRALFVEDGAPRDGGSGPARPPPRNVWTCDAFSLCSLVDRDTVQCEPSALLLWLSESLLLKRWSSVEVAPPPSSPGGYKPKRAYVLVGWVHTSLAAPTQVHACPIGMVCMYVCTQA